MTNEKTTSVPTYVSLCSGYDGIGIGLKRAIPNLRTIAHVEIETYAVANLIAKMEAGQLDACPVFSDLKTFPYRELRNRVTILSAGFPCQPFSSAGKRQATEDPRHLYPWIADGITAMRPRYVLLENVEGIISAKTGDGESVLKYVLGDLESRGYTCTWGVFSASEVGAPHQRKRVFILAELSDTECQRRTELQTKGEHTSKSQPVCFSKERRTKQELGNSSSVGSCGGSTDENGQQSEVFGSGLESTEVGNAKHDGSSTTQDRRSVSSKQEEGRMQELEGRCEQSQTQYPARPGEEQYEWEEPRVVANSKSERSHGIEKEVKQERRECIEQGNEIRSMHESSSCFTGKVEPRVTETQSELGGAVNGTSYRVDRLRLLGNGVVPDTCELAFKTLIQQI